MKIRPRTLSPGWYPGTGEETRETIERFRRDIPEAEPRGCAGVAPHAGWYFSGKIAFRVFDGLMREAETVVVVGGHLHSGDGILAAQEDGYETPLGPLPADLELLEGLRKMVPVEEDRYIDNTVEVQLPFVKYLFPGARALAMRASPSADAIGLGKALRSAADILERRVVVVGSTDLTHYGSNYGFSPAGGGKEALRWVMEVNDRAFIESLLEMRAEEALRHARESQSACSAGGAVAAMTFAGESGAERGDLLSYMTSYDVQPAESFVGYAGILYSA